MEWNAFSQGGDPMRHVELNEEQRAEAARIEGILLARMSAEAKVIAELLASKPNSQLFGATEFELRDRCLAVGRSAVETALEERKKGGTKVPA
jgi:hypothetical protein